MSYRMMTLNTDSTLPGKRQAIIYLPYFFINSFFSIFISGINKRVITRYEFK